MLVQNTKKGHHRRAQSGTETDLKHIIKKRTESVGPLHYHQFDNNCIQKMFENNQVIQNMHEQKQIMIESIEPVENRSNLDDGQFIFGQDQIKNRKYDMFPHEMIMEENDLMQSVDIEKKQIELYKTQKPEIQLSDNIQKLKNLQLVLQGGKIKSEHMKHFIITPMNDKRTNFASSSSKDQKECSIFKPLSTASSIQKQDGSFSDMSKKKSRYEQQNDDFFSNNSQKFNSLPQHFNLDEDKINKTPNQRENNYLHIQAQLPLQNEEKSKTPTYKNFQNLIQEDVVKSGLQRKKSLSQCDDDDTPYKIDYINIMKFKQLFEKKIDDISKSDKQQITPKSSGQTLVKSNKLNVKNPDIGQKLTDLIQKQSDMNQKICEEFQNEEFRKRKNSKQIDKSLDKDLRVKIPKDKQNLHGRKKTLDNISLKNDKKPPKIINTKTPRENDKSYIASLEQQIDQLKSQIIQFEMNQKNMEDNITQLIQDNLYCKQELKISYKKFESLESNFEYFRQEILHNQTQIYQKQPKKNIQESFTNYLHMKTSLKENIQPQENENIKQIDKPRHHREFSFNNNLKLDQIDH